MFRPLALFIGLRYTRAKRRNGFISFISLISMLGLALGVCVLITVLSVMNGFDKQIRERVFSLAPQVTLNLTLPDSLNWQAMLPTLAETPHVIATAPNVEGQGLLRVASNVAPVQVYGILPSAEKHLNALSHLMVQGDLTDLKAGHFGIVLGQTLADNLGITVGEKVMMIVPEMAVNPAGISPIFKRFTVVGIFRAGNGFGFDNHLVFLHLNDAQKLYQLGQAISGIDLRLTDPYLAPQVSAAIQAQFPLSYVSNWTQQYGPFFHAVQLEKTMMFFILLLIIAVAAFNLVSTLVMSVTDKQADIAILRTYGATPRHIMGIFMIQGLFIGLFGTLLGLIAGVLLALNATAIVTWLQNSLHQQLFSSSVYFLDYLPSELNGHDVLRVCMSAILLSLVATLYPAWRASKIQPVEALRHD